MPATEPERPWTKEQLNSDDVGKKVIAKFIQENSSSEFIKANKMGGKVDNAAKKPKDDLIKMFEELFSSKAFRDEEVEAKVAAEKEAAAAATASTGPAKAAEVVDEGPPKFSKFLLKKGEKMGMVPKKGDQVTIRYKGTLEDGTIFDNSTGFAAEGKKKPLPFKFKVGLGKAVRGFDEGILTMTTGEQCKLTIEPEWGYGAKGMPDAKIPPNATLIFEIELMTVN